MVNQKNVSERQVSAQYSYHYTTKKVHMQNILFGADSRYSTPETARISIFRGKISIVFRYSTPEITRIGISGGESE